MPTGGWRYIPVSHPQETAMELPNDASAVAALVSLAARVDALSLR